MVNKIHTDKVISITELKKNPMGIVDDIVEGPVVVLNRNKPVFYCLSPDDYGKLVKLLNLEKNDNVEEDPYV